MSRRLALVAVSVWAAAVIAGLVILLIPEEPKKPLIGRGQWQVEGQFFHNYAPAPGEVSPELSRDVRDYWRSIDGQGSFLGRVESAPFQAPRYLAVPIVGYPGEPGNSIDLECVATGKRLAIAHGNVHEHWVERTIEVPPDFCPSVIRLVAVDQSARQYVGVGAPYESSALAWQKESSLVAVAVHAIVLALLLAPGAALASFLPAAGLGGLPRSFWFVPATLALGFADFFLFYYGGDTGHIISVAAALTLLVVAALRRERVFQIVRDDEMTWVMLAFFLISLAYVLLLYSADNGLGTWAATYRFAPAVWSTDNQLAQTVAEGIWRGSTVDRIFPAGGLWHVSDRPPLMTGAFLLQRPLWETVLAIGSNRRLHYLFYQIAGIVLSSWWVVPLWLLARSRSREKDRQAAWTVALVAMTGFAVFNSLYIWPKLLAGALGLGALLALEQARRRQGAALVPASLAAGCLAGLALMAHGGVVFGLVPVFAAVMVWGDPRRALEVLAVSCVAAVAIVSPWWHWQKAEDPPGNALVKFALAGTFDHAHEDRGVVAAMTETYRREGWRGWLRSRVDAVETVAGVRVPVLVRWLEGARTNVAGAARRAEFLFVLPALGLANLGWLALAFRRRRRGRRPAAHEPDGVGAASWLTLGAAGVLIDVLVAWSMHITSTESYLSLLLIFVGLYALIFAAWPRLRAGFAVLQASYFAAVWLVSPLLETPTRVGFLVAFALTCGACAAVFAQAARRAEGPEPSMSVPE